MDHSPLVQVTPALSRGREKVNGGTDRTAVNEEKRMKNDE
jgi:hypothetical protein